MPKSSAEPLAPWLWFGGLALGAAVLHSYLNRPAKSDTKGIGRVETFPVDDHSIIHVEGLASEYIREGGHSTEVQRVALSALYAQRLTLTSAPHEIAQTLHAFVSSRIRYTPDPAGFERMVHPRTMAIDILAGRDVSGDCDDMAVFLSALYVSVGLPSSVAFLDTDKDGVIDHAVTTVYVGGQMVYAETTVPGKEFGWKPPAARVEVLGLIR